MLVIYIFLGIYLLPMYPHGGSANELTRWATAASIVERGSFDIAWTEELIGPNVDTAKVGDATYSNKAPGVALLTTPVYALARVAIGPPDASNIRISWFLMKLVASTLPLLLLAIWLYRQGVGEFGLALLLFATPLFGYSLLLFSHVLVAVLIYIAYRMLFDEDEGALRRDVMAGAACGLAVVSEFPAAFIVVVLGVGLLFTAEPARRVGAFVMGGVPFLVLLLLYNSALFGSPFSFSYAHESFPEWAAVAARGFFGISFPTLGNAYLLLISPARGLLFYSPILLLGVIALFTASDRSALRHRIKVAVVVVAVVLLCGHGAAHGGWGFGTRYLLLIIPFLLDSFWRAESESKWYPSIVTGALLAGSMVFSTLPVLTFPFAPPEFQLPQNDFWMKFLLDERWFVPTLANVAGMDSSVWVILPVIAAIGIAMLLVVLSARDRSYTAAGMAIGLAVCGVVVLLPGADSAEDQFRRATIAERFFRPAERLEIYRRNAEASADWGTLRRIKDAEWNIADTRSQAPDDFPYLDDRTLGESPSAVIKSAIDAQKRGDLKGAERLLAGGQRRFELARCEFTGNLAVIYYLTARKDEALQQLESVQPLVSPAARPDCMRTQYLLGTLYREMSRDAEAEDVFRQFLRNTAGSTDPEILAFRQQLSRPTQPR
jgi:hypothetical protein